MFLCTKCRYSPWVSCIHWAWYSGQRTADRRLKSSSAALKISWTDCWVWANVSWSLLPTQTAWVWGSHCNNVMSHFLSTDIDLSPVLSLNRNIKCLSTVLLWQQQKSPYIFYSTLTTVNIFIILFTMATSAWKICLMNLFFDEWTNWMMSPYKVSLFFSRKPAECVHAHIKIHPYVKNCGTKL